MNAKRESMAMLEHRRGLELKTERAEHWLQARLCSIAMDSRLAVHSIGAPPNLRYKFAIVASRSS